MKKYGFVVLAILLAAVLYVSFIAVTAINNQERIALVYRTEGFSGFNLKISAQEIDIVFDKAKKSMNTHADNYKTWETVNIIASWIVFVLSAVITLIAGYMGFVNQTSEQVATNLMSSVREKTKAARMIGLVAALATVLTGLSVKAREFGQNEKSRAVEIRDAIIASYKDLQNAPTESDARTVIEKLRLLSVL